MCSDRAGRQHREFVLKPTEGTVLLQITVLLALFSLTHQTAARTWNIDGHLGIVRFQNKHLTAFAVLKWPVPKLTIGGLLKCGGKLDVSLRANAVG